MINKKNSFVTAMTKVKKLDGNIEQMPSPSKTHQSFGEEDGSEEQSINMTQLQREVNKNTSDSNIIK